MRLPRRSSFWGMRGNGLMKSISPHENDDWFSSRWLASGAASADARDTAFPRLNNRTDDCAYGADDVAQPTAGGSENFAFR